MTSAMTTDAAQSHTRLLPSHLRRRVIGAPMAGGPTTPALIAAVGEAGGLGMIGSGYLDAAATRAEIARVRELTDVPFGVNVFLLDEADSAEALAAAGGAAGLREYASTLEPVARRLGIELVRDPQFSDFETGLAATVDWYREHEDWWRPQKAATEAKIGRAHV